MKKLVVVGLMFAVPAFANQISEALIMHEDAIYEYAADHGMSVASNSNPVFANATPGNSFAIRSDVEFVLNGKNIMRNCVSDFLKTSERDFEITALQCE